MVIDYVLLSLHHLREALDAQGLGSRCGHQENVRAWRYGMRPLNVERYLQGPRVARFLARAVVRWRRCSWRVPLDTENVERGHAGAARDSRFAAHVRQTETRVEDVQVRPDSGASERVDQHDCLTVAIQTAGVERTQIVRVAHRRWVEASSTDCEALRLSGRGWRTSDQLIFTYHWPKRGLARQPERRT